MTPRTIPTFRADGRRVRDYSLEAIDRLLALGLIACQYSKKGRITCAQFKSDCGANPLTTTAHMGQSYSYEQQLPGGHYAWKHRELIQAQDAEFLMGEQVERPEEVDLFVRAVFRAVPLSCMTARTEQAVETAPRKRKVVCIDEYRDRVARPRRVRDHAPACRPIEFDSQRRAA